MAVQVQMGKMQDKSNEIAPRTLARRFRVGLWIMAWAIALVVPLGLLDHREFSTYSGMIPLFPLGLAFFFDFVDSIPASLAICLAIGSWVAYIALTVYAFTQTRALRYYIAFGILCILLAMNIAGWGILQWPF